MPAKDLQEFLRDKAQLARPAGFGPVWLPDCMFPFQKELARWSLRMGRSLILADCGLGKTLLALCFAANVARKTNGRTLILTPLAVSQQFIAEGVKFDIPCERSRDGKPRGDITVTNYEQVEKFNPADFAGVVCDESSCIKNWQGKRRALLTEFLRQVPYRLLDTATPAPNDYHELGTSSEALGHLGYFDMLAYFFINDENSLHPTSLGARWRFKKAAEMPFWRWVCSWARALRRPSDVTGSPADDARFELPPLNNVDHIVENTHTPPGFLPGITVEAVTLQEQREERRLNIHERCSLAAKLADHDRPVVLWTDYNAEADLLEEMVPDALQVSGSMPDEQKLERFTAFGNGGLRALITKPKIGAWGLNWQHCNHVISFVSHSFEQDYQAVRRCWRFGQTRPVTVDRIATPGEARVLRNLRRKADQAARMFDQLVEQMNRPEHMLRGLEISNSVEVPSWLT